MATISSQGRTFIGQHLEEKSKGRELKGIRLAAISGLNAVENAHFCASQSPVHAHFRSKKSRKFISRLDGLALIDACRARGSESGGTPLFDIRTVRMRSPKASTIVRKTVT
jgi:hypothetical protein